MKYKFKLWTYTPIDVKAAEAELNRMAKAGYTLLGLGGFPTNIAVYEKSNRAKRKRYAVDYNKDESEAAKEERKTFFKEAGWSFVSDGNGNLCIYATEKTGSKEIYSDIDTRLEGIEGAVTLGKNTGKALRGCFYRIAAAITYLFSAVSFPGWGYIWPIVLQALVIVGIIAGDSYTIFRLRRIKKSQGALTTEQSKTAKVLNQISALAEIGVFLCFIFFAIATALRDENTIGEQIVSTIAAILLGMPLLIGVVDTLCLCFERTRNSTKLQRILAVLTIIPIILGGILLMFSLF